MGKSGNKSGKSDGQKLEELKQKQAVLKARVEQLEARERAKERKQDLRRKILVGAFVLKEAEMEGKTAELYQEMDGFLSRNSDRVLFGLEARLNTNKGSENSKEKSQPIS